MAITDIISEEEISTPNMEVARGGPEDFMTDDEMDPYQDSEFQQLLESLPMEQAEVLMQLIKEFKMMVAQGFTGEFEDFVKMKMASAQGGPEDFMSEEEMQIGPEEQQSLIPMTQQVAQGGRIGYQQGGGGIMDVELVPAIKWLKDRNLPVTPENIQRAMLEMSREVIPQALIGQDITETVIPDVASMRIAEEVVPEDDVFSDQEMRDMKQDYIDKGGTFDKASWGIEDDVEDSGIMQTRDPIFYSDDEITYTDDEQKEWRQQLDTMMKDQNAFSPTSSLWQLDEKIKEGVNKGWISQEDYLKNWQMPFFGRRGERKTEEIDRYRDWAFNAEGGRIGYQGGGDTAHRLSELIKKSNAGTITPQEEHEMEQIEIMLDYGPGEAQGGRIGYGLGSLVKSVFKGAKKGVKGLTKSIKKFAKSDLGKMALMYMATAGMANIGAGGSWASPFAKGTGWLRPSTVIGDFGKTGWGNIGKSLTNLGFGGDKLKSGQTLYKKIGVDPKALARKGVEEFLYQPVSSGSTNFLSGLGQSFKKSPFPWIAGTAGLAGLYTAKNPGEDNLDEVMRNYKGEVSDWDKMIADIRAGQGVTPFATDNVLFPYPNYYQLAGGGRVAAQEGGLMDLGGMEKDYRNEGGFVPIGGKEKADDVPARLSRNEFVFTADAVRNAGGGDVDRGAEVMENVMTNLEQGGSISEESQGLEGARDMFEVSERLSEVV